MKSEGLKIRQNALNYASAGFRKKGRLMMRRAFIYVLAGVAMMLLAQPIAFAKTKKVHLSAAQKKIWTTTNGVVAVGSSASVGIANDDASPDQGVSNAGCPTSDLPYQTEVVIAQGSASAPTGTTANWALTVQGNAVLADPAGIETAHIVEYIGAAPDGCTDFASCTANMTPVTIEDASMVPDDSGNPSQINVPFVADTSVAAPSGLAPTDTAAYFITATINSEFGEGDGTCVNASFVPIAHSLQ